MSRLKGITFVNQNVEAAHDGGLRARFIHDGIVSGFDITIMGDTISVAPGLLVVAGRLVEVEDTATIQTNLQSGVARLLVDVDMTKTSTEDFFEQADIIMQYADTRNGFPELMQDDVNAGGSHYQFVLAIMDVAAGILSNMEQTVIGAQLIHTYGRKVYTNTATINIEDNVLYTVNNANSVTINIPDGECQAHVVVKAPAGVTPKITLYGVDRYNGDSLSLIGAGDAWEFAILDGMIYGQRWFK